MLRWPGCGLVVRSDNQAAVILASVRRGGTRGLKIVRSEVEATVERVVLPMGTGGDFQFFLGTGLGEFDRNRFVGWLFILRDSGSGLFGAGEMISLSRTRMGWLGVVCL